MALQSRPLLLINEPKFVDEFDDEALKFLTLVDGWSLSACPALVVCCADVGCGPHSAHRIDTGQPTHPAAYHNGATHDELGERLAQPTSCDALQIN